jgi:hypothetical protein
METDHSLADRNVACSQLSGTILGRGCRKRENEIALPSITAYIQE